MTESIKLYRHRFGHISLLNVATDFVTHAHGEVHIIIPLEGIGGEMTVGRQTRHLNPNLAVGINSFQPHSHALAQDRAPGSFLAFYIDPGWIRHRRCLAPNAPIFATPFIPLQSWLRATAACLLHRLDGSVEADDFTCYEVERFIDSFVEASDDCAPEPRSNHTCSTNDFRVRKAIELMKARVCDRICFTQVARSVGLSRPHFFALFKEHMNLTPNVYWNTLRMTEAVRQVECSDESLVAVASKLGFTSQSNFSRFFRDHAGVPPTVYRSAARSV
jgi:AraC family transcriptional regulator